MTLTFPHPLEQEPSKEVKKPVCAEGSVLMALWWDLCMHTGGSSVCVRAGRTYLFICVPVSCISVHTSECSVLGGVWVCVCVAI